MLHKIKKLICRALDHVWDEFHMYDVVCSRCGTCREYTTEDLWNLELKKRGL